MQPGSTPKPCLRLCSNVYVWFLICGKWQSFVPLQKCISHFIYHVCVIMCNICASPWSFTSVVLQLATHISSFLYCTTTLRFINHSYDPCASCNEDRDKRRAQCDELHGLGFIPWIYIGFVVFCFDVENTKHKWAWISKYTSPFAVDSTTMEPCVIWNSLLCQ